MKKPYTKKQTYINEINKTLNSKIYYIPESKVMAINISKNYKVKTQYLSNKEALLNIIINTTPLLYKKISIFLDDNYHKPDLEIFESMYNLLISMDFTETDATAQINLIKQKI
jgi:hypothetical protein